MEILITAKTIKEVAKALGDAKHTLGDAHWRYANAKPRDQVRISLDELDVDGLAILQKVMRDNDEEEVRKVSKLLNSLRDPANKPVPSLKDFVVMFKTYLEGCKRPLLHSLDAELRGVAYLPVSAVYREPPRNAGSPYVSVTLGYNTKMHYSSYLITLYARDMRVTVPEILRRHNLMVPDESMSEEYTKIIARFEDYGSLNGEQFWVRGKAPVISGEDDEDSYWWRSDQIDLTHLEQPTKSVLDMRVVTAQTNRHQQGSYGSIPVDLFGDNVRAKVPTHPVLPMFSLAHHKTVWVNVVNMKKYKYEEGLRDKLVLPATHAKLIGALVSNLDALRTENAAEDKSRTIKSKASSSLILAKGPAGTGKTLTAEVYAEEIKRPLYEVQSGQIGTEAGEIEKNLKRVLDRSIRLNMPLLINEADVFIKSRGDDMAQNAIVSVFLRLLEYHTGLVFLTTNRGDIDDAILSRCIAIISYSIPKPSERLRLWQILLKEFNVELSNPELRKAVLMFPLVTGRDIQNIIRLTNRVCTAVGEKFSLQALRDNAVFKDVKVLSDAELEAEIARRRVADTKG